MGGWGFGASGIPKGFWVGLSAVLVVVAIVLLATDPMARIDVPFLMSQKDGRVLEIDEADGLLRITIETGARPYAPTD